MIVVKNIINRPHCFPNIESSPLSIVIVAFFRSVKASNLVLLRASGNIVDLNPGIIEDVITSCKLLNIKFKFKLLGNFSAKPVTIKDSNKILPQGKRKNIIIFLIFSNS
jgi:hypothetical protein